MLEHYGVEISAYRKSAMVSCVLHDDRHPSMSVNLDRNVWKCHSCGEGGDTYTLIKLKEATDFDGARAFAASLGIPEGGAGGSDSEVPGSSSRYTNRRSVPARPGDRPRDGGFVPSWRR